MISKMKNHIFMQLQKYMKDLVNNQWYDEGHHITFFTAREEKDREVTIKWLDDNGFKYHGLIMNKPRCLNDEDVYCWIDNRKVMGVTYKGVWGPLVERVATIKTM